MAQSLTKSSASLVAAGGDLAEAAALTATANAIIQDADSVGTALKTTSLRLRGTDVKVLEEEGLDSEGAVTSKSKLQSKVKALSGVDILTATGEYKSTYEILSDIADVWESISDMDQAALLELISGKRNSSVIAAILQNPQELKDAYKDAMDAEGSALKENEKYLDSIQGKIDQFKNATQSMWSGFLDADVVKFVVELGTKLIKLVDTLGLIPSILITIGAFKGLQFLFKGMSLTQMIQDISALTMGTKMFSAETMKATMATAAETAQFHLANSALIQYAVKMKLAEAADISKMTTTQLLGLGFKALGVAIWSATKAVLAFLFTNPVGWAILATTVVLGAVAAWNKWGATTENLTEKLEGLKSELSDVRSELESVNSELETTKERMAELLAKDKLTFEEQEELDKLRATNDELERRKELLEAEEEHKSGLVGRQAARVVDSTKSEKDWWESKWLLGGGVTGLVAEMFGGFNDEGEEAENNIENYRKLKEKYDKASSLKEQEKYQKKLDKEAEKIDAYILELSEALDGVEYGDSEESDKALDYLAELQNNYGIARGDAGAKTNVIKGVFNKPEFESMSKAINYYVEALKDGDESAAESIAEIINNNEDLVADLNARGVEAEDAIKHFTLLGSEMVFDTPEKKLDEIKRATEKLPAAFNDVGKFMDGDKVDKTAIAEYFKGMSDKTHEEIAKLIQDINDGNIDVENALKKFELFGIQSVIEIEITEVQTNFKDTFTDLENADGLINTFQELADAIGSTSKAMDALNAAQAEMDYSGRVSIETALKLMESTDDYSKVLTISEGKLVLAEDAEENLIEARLEGMKASALKALEDAKAARETTVLARSTAETALSTYNSAIESEMAAAVTATAWDKVLAAAAGLWAGIKSLFTDESWTEAYDRAYQETLNSLGGDRTAEVKAKYATAEEQARKAQLEKDVENADKAIEEQDKEIKKLQGNYDLVSGLNKDNIGSVFKSDDIEDPEKAKEKKLDEVMDAFQREMDYWENRIGANQARYEQLQNEIDLLEAKGQKADASFYDEQIKLENERLWLLEKQKSAAEAHLAAFTEGSEEWWEVANTLNDVESELDDVTASIVDLQDAIGEIDAYRFEEFNNRLDNLTSKLGTIRDLIAPNGEEDWFDDEGQWTEEGVAVLGAHIQELEFDKEGLKKAQEELDKYDLSYGGNEAYYEALGIHSEQEYYDKVEELTEQQYQYLESINDTEQSIVDMYESNIDAVEEYTETLIDSYNDYIDSVKEALDAERDLYDFKKNVQKQSKDIAAIERRIASLSGSTNASDIAERRKLEAELYESRESLNDTYYDHARNAQDEALDAEQIAYEESMTKFVDGLRTSLETATMNMDEFLMGVTSMVMYNADTVLTKYQETNLPLTDELTNPWIAAKEAVGTYSGDALALMNKWTEEGGFFAQFNATGTKNLESPWTAGSTAAGDFKDSVSVAMNEVVSKIETNVVKAKQSLQSLTDVIHTTATQADGSVGESYSGNSGSGNTGGSTGGGSTSTPAQTTPTKTSTPTRPASPTRPTFKKVGDMWSGVGHTGVSIGKKAYNKSLEIEGADAIYYPYTNGNGYKGYIRKGEGYTVLGNGKMDIHTFKPIYQKYAKGTISTARDDFALTDEPKFGDELVLIPGKDGNLSFMRKGTGVVPADMTQKLFELAQIPTSDLMNKNMTAIVPNITKNDFKNEFNFESLVHVDTVDSDTLPKLEKMVDKKIDDFSKALNYSLKRFAR